MGKSRLFLDKNMATWEEDSREMGSGRKESEPFILARGSTP